MLTAYLLLSGAVWLLMLVGALRAKPGLTSKPMTRASIRRWRAFAVVCLAWALLLLVTGCGGGDPEPDAPRPGVDCQARPELCA